MCNGWDPTGTSFWIVVASGFYVNYSPAMRVHDSPELTQFLTEGLEVLVGGIFCFEENTDVAAELMMAHMDKKTRGPEAALPHVRSVILIAHHFTGGRSGKKRCGTHAAVKELKKR